MAQQRGSKVYNTFVKGLNTDATALTFPDNSSLDERNMVLLTDGSRRRRNGIDYEVDAVLNAAGVPISLMSDQVINSYEWFSVNDDSDINFLVVQVFNKLYFFDYSAVPLSSGLKSFTVNIDTFLAAGSTLSGTEYCDFATGRGALFVANNKIEPFYIKYDSGTDTVATTFINMRIRDMTGVNDALPNDQQPATLSTLHRYNLYNQGWVNPGGVNQSFVGSPGALQTITQTITNSTTANSYIESYKSNAGNYPSNAQQWQVGKLDDGSINYTTIKNTNFGSTRAARGHFILNAFYRDRNAASGLTGLTVETTVGRPKTCTGFSGRIWWAVNSTLYYSQILDENLLNAGNCYQEADPTAEEINALVDTDGGVILIPDAIDIKCIRSLGNTLVVLADNGVWVIAGNSQSGFKATDYQVSSLGDAGAINLNTVVTLEGNLSWWSTTGIFMLATDDLGSPKIQSITNNAIKRFYDAIPVASRLHAKGVYDKANRTLQWCYAKEIQTNKQRIDQMLLFSLDLSAYYLYDISQTDSTPFITGFITLPTVTTIFSEGSVLVGTDPVVVTGGTAVVTLQPSLDTNTTYIKYFTLVPDGSNFDMTFSEFSNNEFVDWEQWDDVGIEFDSFLLTGYLNEGDVAHEKQAPYILCYFKRTETNFSGNDDDGYTLLNPSSCLLQSRWNWSDASTSNKWSATQQVYRFRQDYPVPNTLNFDNGLPVVVSKSKLRGRGKSVHLYFKSEPRKDLVLLGWHMVYNINTEE